MITRRNFLIASALTLVASKAGAADNLLPHALDANATPVNDMMLASLQCFAVDDKRGIVYAQYPVSRTVHQTLISRFQFNRPGLLQPLDTQPPSDLLGHQGLTIEFGEVPHFWTGGPERGHDVVRFAYQANGEPQNVQTFKLFDATYENAGITTAVSYDQTYLLAVSHTNAENGRQYRLRVFDLKTLVQNGPGDYSSNSVYEWDIPTQTGVPVQGLASDGKIVWISYGDPVITKTKPLYSFDIDGTPRDMIPDMMIGKSVAFNSGEIRSYEPEGLCYAKLGNSRTPSLLVGFNLGGKTGHIRRIYNLGEAYTQG